MAELDALKINLRNYTESITQHSKNGLYVCPLCSSGTGAKHTGAFSIDKSGERWKCFSCGNGGDIFDLCAAYEHISLSDATRRIMELYGRPTRSSAAADFAPEPARKEAPPEEKPMHDFSTDIARFAAALPGSSGETYLQGRGFTRETMQRFKLGYNIARGSIVIPYNPEGSYYLERSTSGKSFYKPKAEIAGSEPVFNAAALYSSDAVFITESPLCAISIAQAGGAAVAIGGTGSGKLTALLKSKPTKAALILCLDNDEPGRKATAALDAELSKLELFHVDGTAAVMGTQTDEQAADYRKDPNDVLQKSGADELKAAVTETADLAREAQASAAQEQEAERAQRSGAGMVDAFLQAIQTLKYKPMPTGISDIDKALCGGFMRAQIVTLGAAPGVGKTALAQWIFEGMAQRDKIATLYLNLEMSREQVLARSLARIAARQGRKIKPIEVLQGYRWNEYQRAAVERAAAEYKETIAPYITYNPDGISADLDAILNYITQEAQRSINAGQEAPVIVLDYLHLIRGRKGEEAAEIIKRAMDGLKGYAVQYNTLVFVIQAHNRESNEKGQVTQSSGRDTSAIEYGADLQMGLTYTACMKRPGQDKKNPDNLSKEEKKFVTLRVTKSRWSEPGAEIDLMFNGETMTYTPIVKDFDETRPIKKEY